MILKKLTVEKIISNSAGLARDEGKTVFIPYTIPGETVAAEITDTGKGYFTGELKEIITPSPYRTEPVCPLFIKCGGCTMQHIEYNYQVEIRKSLIIEAVSRNGKADCGTVAAIIGKPYNYRNRVQFHPDRITGMPGFMKRNENSVIQVHHCPVCVNGINKYLSDVKKPVSGRTIVFSPTDDKWYAADTGGSNEVIKTVLKERVFKSDLSCFFQSNLTLFEKALDQISDSCPSGGTVIDFYSGTGIIGSFVSHKADRLIFVEQSGKALDYARQNITERKGLQVKFFAAKSENFVKGNYAAGIYPDTVIADPPRSGIPASVRDYIIRKKVKNILYLSCDCNTLGRDLGIFIRAGYEIDKMFLYDFYPQTEHTETLAVLRFRE